MKGLSIVFFYRPKFNPVEENGETRLSHDPIHISCGSRCEPEESWSTSIDPAMAHITCFICD
jgi:hypothetical protein